MLNKARLDEEGSPEMIGLILDTDIGDDVDDVFALAYAALHPDIELLAVTTVWNDTRWKAALALALLDAIGVVDVPVAAGFGVADGAASPRPVERMSGDVLVPLDTTDPRIDPRHAVDLIHDVASSAAGPVWLATIGQATNAAAALDRHPELRGRLAGLAMMGGRRDDTDRYEYNLSCDVAAAVCGLQLGRPGSRRRLPRHPAGSAHHGRSPRASRGQRSRPVLAEMLAAHFARRKVDRTSMFDPATLTLALDQRFLTLDPTPLTARDDDGHVAFVESDRPTGLRVAAAIDAAAFKRDLLGIITGA